MKVEILVSMAGDVVYQVGDVTEVGDAIARKMIGAGLAKTIGRETAAVVASEKATKQVGKPRIQK